MVSFHRATANLIELDRFPAVQDDGLAVGLDLLAAPRPEERVPPARRVAERVAGGLADGPSLGLQLLAGIAKGIPGLGERRVAGLLEPRLAIGDQSAADGPRHANPLVADRRNLPADVVVAALGLADLLGQVARVGQAFGVELRPVADGHDDVGAGAGLDRRGDARLQVVGVDRLELEVDAGRLLAFLGDRALEENVRGRHEVGPSEPVDARLLGERRCATAGQDGGHAAGCGKLQNATPRDASHDFLPSLSCFEVLSRRALELRVLDRARARAECR